MARSRIINPIDDLVSDSGSVLFSLIQGEQLEYPILLEGLELPPSEYDVTSRLLEAENIFMQNQMPVTLQPAGAESVISVRTPTYRGEWQMAVFYAEGELVYYANKYYLCVQSGAGLGTNTAAWREIPMGTAYLRFTADLSTDWNVQPSPNFNVYGFLEVRVEEKVGAFKRVWKPIRGMVEYQFTVNE